MKRDYLVPSAVLVYVVLALCVAGFFFAFHRAYKEELHSQETAQHLMDHVCHDAELTLKTGLLDRCHLARHHVEDSVVAWRTLVAMLVPEGSRGWAFLNVLLLAGFVVLFAGIVFVLRQFEPGRHFTNALLPEQQQPRAQRAPRRAFP
jgi:hypothetical protein